MGGVLSFPDDATRWPPNVGRGTVSGKASLTDTYLPMGVHHHVSFEIVRPDLEVKNF